MSDPQLVWDALAHPARRAIVDRLRTGPATSGALHDHLETLDLTTTRFTTNRHVQALRDAGLVLVTPSGRERINSLNGSALYEATIGWLDPPSRHLASSLHRLRTLAEQPDRPRTTGGTQPPDRPDQRSQRSEETAMPDVRQLSVHQSITLDASRERIWHLVTERTREWWQPPFTLLGTREETELVIPTAPGQPVKEVAGERSAAWGMLVKRDEREHLEWTSGVCGAPASTGMVRIDLEDAAGGGTTLSFRQDAIGVFDEQTDANVEAGWASKLETITALLS